MNLDKFEVCFGKEVVEHDRNLIAGYLNVKKNTGDCLLLRVSSNETFLILLKSVFGMSDKGGTNLCFLRQEQKFY